VAARRPIGRLSARFARSVSSLPIIAERTVESQPTVWDWEIPTV
jgi:hypothetical protein